MSLHIQPKYGKIQTRITPNTDTFRAVFLSGWGYFLKSVGLSPDKKVVFIFFNENTLKMMKNAFCFMSEALCVFRIFKYLP